MKATPLAEKLARKGVSLGDYCGATTALSFGDSPQEFRSLVRGCGIYDLGWRAHFRIAGKDRVRWLNGMVSNNIRELPPGRGNYSFVLTAQGHIQGDLCVYNLGEYFIASTDRSQLEKLLVLLDRYIIMDQVELTNMGEELTAIAVQGPHAPGVLAALGVDTLPQPMEIRPVPCAGVTADRLLLTRMSDGRYQGYELWASPAEASLLWDKLCASATPVGMQAVEMFRVAAGIPRYGQDIRERDLPQETAQTQALSSTKGCYVGQEIVERIRSRGSVHRTFTGFTLQGPPPAIGSKIIANGKEAGEITSALSVPSVDAGEQPDSVLALGYIRREFAQPGTLVEAAGSRAIVTQVPFSEILFRELNNVE